MFVSTHVIIVVIVMRYFIYLKKQIATGQVIIAISVTWLLGVCLKIIKVNLSRVAV